MVPLQSNLARYQSEASAQQQAGLEAVAAAAVEWDDATSLARLVAGSAVSQTTGNELAESTPASVDAGAGGYDLVFAADCDYADSLHAMLLDAVSLPRAHHRHQRSARRHLCWHCCNCSCCVVAIG